MWVSRAMDVDEVVLDVPYGQNNVSTWECPREINES